MPSQTAVTQQESTFAHFNSAMTKITHTQVLLTACFSFFHSSKSRQRANDFSSRLLPPHQGYACDSRCMCNCFDACTVLAVCRSLGRGRSKGNKQHFITFTSADSTRHKHRKKMANFARKVGDRNQWRSTFCKWWYRGDRFSGPLTEAQIPSISSSPLTSSNSMLSSSSSSPKLTVSLILACSGSSP